jgi:3-dehydroquinate dehydratase/shikimate dehydrogenase
VAPAARSRRRTVRTDGRTGSLVCLSLTGSTLAEDLEVLDSRRAWIDAVELRADFLDAGELAALSRFPALAGLPVILALRRKREGGRWTGEESRRRSLLAGAVSGGYAYVELEEDLEDLRLARAAVEAGGRVIRSFHDISGLPDRIVERCRRLPRSAGEIPKLAVTPRSTHDLVALAEAFQRLRGEEKILIGMGERGLFSRLLATRLGSLLTYCSAENDRPAAPGHLDPRTLVELYRFRAQDQDTFVCAVIGKPIAHSRSPEFHNKGYAALGLNGVYIPFLVDEVGPFFHLAELLELRGFSVTIPHKEAVMPLLTERDQRLKAIGACNTVVRRQTGSGERREVGWFGTNTDVEGFLSPLERQAPELLNAATRATVIGAGGAARSVVYALRSRGLRPLIANRTPQRAESLAERFGCPWTALDRAGTERIRDNCDLIVQATCVGMHPASEADPAPGYSFTGREAVYDLVYQPQLTSFLKRARAAGCRTISGLDMLFCQAAAQFRHYTGQDYPWEIVKK